MKPKLLLLFILFFSINIFAQLDINEPFGRNNEYVDFSDSSVHSNFSPSYFENKDSLLQFSVSPIYYISPKFDLANSRLYENLYFGTQFDISYKKFQLNTSLYIGMRSKRGITGEITDTLFTLPIDGILLKLSDNKAFYGNIVGDFSYQPSDFITFQIGNNKVFLGDGYRSLILSDFSNPYPYFKTTVKIWKIQYLWMISHQQGYDNRFSTYWSDFKAKNIFTHYLSFNFFRWFNFSMFETVVTSPIDSIGGHRGLDFNYLNPVIFYRPVEMSIGSPDNVLVGFTGHLKFFKSTMLYGQVFIDEFILSHIKSSDEYWDEKYGIQAGYKCYNTFNVKNLYTQLEFNATRPYTYSHSNPINAYTNANLPLAHPLGANFIEAVGIVSYQYKDYFAELKLSYAKYGDNDTINYGHNPILSYNSRISDNNILWLQGVKTSLATAQFSFGFRKKRVLLEFDLIYRRLSSAVLHNNLYVGTRFGIPLFKQYWDN